MSLETTLSKSRVNVLVSQLFCRTWIGFTHFHTQWLASFSNYLLTAVLCELCILCTCVKSDCSNRNKPLIEI